MAVRSGWALSANNDPRRWWVRVWPNTAFRDRKVFREWVVDNVPSLVGQIHLYGGMMNPDTRQPQAHFAFNVCDEKDITIIKLVHS